jgi:hypothetical protein
VFALADPLSPIAPNPSQAASAAPVSARIARTRLSDTFNVSVIALRSSWRACRSSTLRAQLTVRRPLLSWLVGILFPDPDPDPVDAGDLCDPFRADLVGLPVQTL